jgi:hypothetical protein
LKLPERADSEKHPLPGLSLFTKALDQLDVGVPLAVLRRKYMRPRVGTRNMGFLASKCKVSTRIGWHYKSAQFPKVLARNPHV